MNKPAPIALFAFARPEHTRRTLESLANNALASQSHLIVFADGPRSEADRKHTNEVRAIAKSIKGFKQLEVVERPSNLGLAANIMLGVSEVVTQHGRIIVLEDDLVTSPRFLQYMNAALDRYATIEKVWHISGWNYPIDPEGLGDSFFTRVMNCWGWATWHDRWQHFSKDPHHLITRFDRRLIRDFDVDDSGNFWPQVSLNLQGKIDTWAIFWYATIFLNEGLCLNPSVSYVDNIGLDNSGTHSRETDRVHRNSTLNNSQNIAWPSECKENATARQRISTFLQSTKKAQNRSIWNALNRIKRAWT